MKHNVLVLAGDRWHPADIPRQGLAGIGEFDWIENTGDFSPDLLRHYSAVILAKCNHKTPADTTPWADDQMGAAFRSYVENGGGLLLVHGGCAGYGGVPAMRGLPAGAFDQHPAPCPVTLEPLPSRLTKGVSAFTENDEHYFMQMDDPAVAVFLRSNSSHGTQPAGWTREVGKGRVCVITPGHTQEVWMHPSFQQLLKNSLGWVLRHPR